MSDEELERLKGLIAEGKTDRFYHWDAWERLRDRVLRLDNYECQLCKAQGRYARAAVVHHVAHVKDRPDLALSVYGDDGERQLISVCKRCHSEIHELDFTQTPKEKGFDNKERWD